MITIAICLIYYGAAVWLYQVHLWFSIGHWVPIPVMVAWRAGFGVPEADHTISGTILSWFLSWPLSLTLLALGGSILAAVAGVRRLRAVLFQQRRQKWMAEQCAQAGYRPWTVPKVLAGLEASAPMTRAEDKRRFN